MAAEQHTLVPPGPVLIPLGCAALAEGVAWALALAPGTLGPGWYGRTSLLVVVHTLTLGVVAASILGAGWQLIPVITARPWRPPAGALTALFLAGLPLLLAGLAFPGLPGTIGGVLVLLALLGRSLLVLGALLSARGRPVARAWLVGAELCLWLGLGVAAALWAGRIGHPVFQDPLRAVAWHAALLLGGWVGGSIIGYGSVLLPMFFVAPEPAPAVLAVGGALWFGGIAAGSTSAWSLGALLVAATLARALWRGLRRAFGQAAFGLAGLALLPALLAWLRTDARAAEMVFAAALTLFVLPILRGMAQKIAPYLIWAHMNPGLPVPPAPPLARWQAWISAAGAVLLVASRAPLGDPVAAAQPAAASVGAGLLLLGAIAQLVVLGTLGARLTLANIRRGAIPGMESSR